MHKNVAEKKRGVKIQNANIFKLTTNNFILYIFLAKIFWKPVQSVLWTLPLLYSANISFNDI